MAMHTESRCCASARCREALLILKWTGVTQARLKVCRLAFKLWFGMQAIANAGEMARAAAVAAKAASDSAIQQVTVLAKCPHTKKSCICEMCVCVSPCMLMSDVPTLSFVLLVGRGKVCMCVALQNVARHAMVCVYVCAKSSTVCKTHAPMQVAESLLRHTICSHGFEGFRIAFAG